MISRKELMKRTGVSVDTLKHYKKINLLCPINEKELEMSDKNHKHQWLYDDSALGTLNLIMIYRDLGYGLDDIKKMLEKDSIDFGNDIANAINELEKKKQEIDCQIGYLSALSELAIFDELSIEQLEHGHTYLNDNAKNDIKQSKETMMAMYREVYDNCGSECAKRLLEAFRFVYKLLSLMLGGARPDCAEIQDTFGSIIEGFARSIFESEINESNYSADEVRSRFFTYYYKNIYSEDSFKEMKAVLSQEGLNFLIKVVNTWMQNNKIQ